MTLIPYYELVLTAVFSITVFILLWIAIRTQRKKSELIHVLTRAVTAGHDLDEISAELFKELSNRLETASGYITFLDAGHMAWDHSFRVDTTKVNAIALQTMVLELLGDQKKVIFAVSQMKHAELKKLLLENDIELMIPLIVYREISGILLVGKKKSGRRYTHAEIDVLQAIEPVLTIAVKNAYFYRKLSELTTTLHDKMKFADQKVEAANQKMGEMDKSKDEFIAIASHELRTPITAIKGYIWMCLNQSKQPLSEQVQKHLETCYHSSERLLRMVSDMLTVSRMDGGKMALNIQKVDVASLLSGLHEEMMALAKPREIEFTLKTDQPSVLIDGDRERLQELFHNVMDNAIKFAPHRGIVKVQLHVNGDRDISVLISDNGPGIPKENRDLLFTKFGKIQYAYDKTHAVEGAGLGLYISKKIVDLHSGIISVESEVDKGTTFIITLPLKRQT